MEFKILDKKDESLLSRVEVRAEATFQGVTPSKVELKKQIASSLKVDEKLIVVKNVKTFFGKEKVVVIALKYEDEDALKRTEPKSKAKKGEEAQPATEEKKEAPAKEEGKAEKKGR